MKEIPCHCIDCLKKAQDRADQILPLIASKIQKAVKKERERIVHELKGFLSGLPFENGNTRVFYIPTKYWQALSKEGK